MILNYVRIRNIMLLCESLCRNHMNFHVLPVHLDMDFCCVKKGLKLYISNPSFDFARSASKETSEWGSERWWWWWKGSAKEIWVEEEERKRVLVFNALTDICVTVYLSSKNILRFRLMFASCGNSGVWRAHTQ